MVVARATPPRVIGMTERTSLVSNTSAHSYVHRILFHVFFLYLFNVFFSHCSTSSNRHTCAFLFIPPVSERFFLFFFVVSKPNSDRFPNTRPSFPWSTTLAQKWLKQATFPVVLASVFSFMFSIHQLLMISIHHAVVKPSFLFFFPSYCWYCSIIVHIYILKSKDPFF